MADFAATIRDAYTASGTTVDLGRRRRAGTGPDEGARPALRAGVVPRRVPLARRHRARRPGARDRHGLRPAAPLAGAPRERDAGVEPRAPLPLRRRARPAAPRPR